MLDLRSLASVTRVDIVGDAVHEFWAEEWMVSLQDDGRTIKLFAIGDGLEAKADRSRALAVDLLPLTQCRGCGNAQTVDHQCAR